MRGSRSPATRVRCSSIPDSGGYVRHQLFETPCRTDKSLIVADRANERPSLCGHSPAGSPLRQRIETYLHYTRKVSVPSAQTTSIRLRARPGVEPNYGTANEEPPRFKSDRSVRRRSCRCRRALRPCPSLPGTAPGRFSVRSRKQREVGRNPATSEAIQITASKKVTFQPTKSSKRPCGGSTLSHTPCASAAA